ncbi:BTAD domain-containing putative transcriptional regulator [Streptomyces sp. NPDC059786]|uniref:BTAD domain-containing putative transcriptional regulator n=1 Tax=Streptomyces sp. NPDC059786 TaxID=3346946 RepID=UPI0036611490
MTVWFGLLGGVEVRIGGRPVPVGAGREECLLAALLVDAGTPVPHGRLVDRVFGDRPPRRPLDALHGGLARLRRLLAGAEDAAVERRGGGYRLRVDTDSVDLHRFGRLLREARACPDEERAHALYESALGLWRGEPFGTLDNAWVRRLRAALEQERLAAELDRDDIVLRHGGHERLLAELPARVADHPLDERLAGQLMCALHQAGRAAEALGQYQRIRRRLAEEFGVEPGSPLQHLHRGILAGQPAHTGADRPPAPVTGPARTPAPTPRHLPVTDGAFVGRGRELAFLDAQLAAAGDGSSRARVVAVSGAAGTGKTACTVHWARRVADRFPDGQIHADLRGYGPNGSPVAPSEALYGFLEALGAGPERIPAELGGRTALFRALVAGRRLLFVLDNAHDTDQVEPLLPAAPGCLVLVTSRRRLTGLVVRHQARHLSLGPLPHPAARALLAERLGERRVAEDPCAADELPYLCGHLPLALAITAAWATTHPDRPLRLLTEELRAEAHGDPHGEPHRLGREEPHGEPHQLPPEEGHGLPHGEPQELPYGDLHRLLHGELHELPHGKPQEPPRAEPHRFPPHGNAHGEEQHARVRGEPQGESRPTRDESRPSRDESRPTTAPHPDAGTPTGPAPDPAYDPASGPAPVPAPASTHDPAPDPTSGPAPGPASFFSPSPALVPSPTPTPVLACSYRALSPRAARLFRLLALVPGADVALPAVVSLAGRPPADVRGLLGELVAAGLVSRGGAGRYLLHDLVRAYAGTRLAADTADAERHAATDRLLGHYLHSSVAADRLLDEHRDPVDTQPSRLGVVAEAFGTPEQAARWYAAEHAALVAAVAQASRTGFDGHAWRLAWSLSTHLEHRGCREVWMRVQRTGLAAARRARDAAGIAHALHGLGLACARSDRHDEARFLLADALDRYTRLADDPGRAHTHLTLSWSYRRQARHPEALEHALAALRCYSAAGSVPGQADALDVTGSCRALLADHRQALHAFRRALDLFERAGDRAGQARSRAGLAFVQHALGDHAAARTSYGAAEHLLRGLDHARAREARERLAGTPWDGAS